MEGIWRALRRWTGPAPLAYEPDRPDDGWRDGWALEGEPAGRDAAPEVAAWLHELDPLPEAVETLDDDDLLSLSVLDSGEAIQPPVTWAPAVAFEPAVPTADDGFEPPVLTASMGRTWLGLAGGAVVLVGIVAAICAS